jgi:hypothetical protein
MNIIEHRCEELLHEEEIYNRPTNIFVRFSIRFDNGEWRFAANNQLSMQCYNFCPYCRCELPKQNQVEIT